MTEHDEEEPVEQEESAPVAKPGVITSEGIKRHPQQGGRFG